MCCRAECRVSSVECRVSSVECRVWRVSTEPRVRCHVLDAAATEPVAVVCDSRLATRDSSVAPLRTSIRVLLYFPSFSFPFAHHFSCTSCTQLISLVADRRSHSPLFSTPSLSPSPSDLFPYCNFILYTRLSKLSIAFHFLIVFLTLAESCRQTCNI